MDTSLSNELAETAGAAPASDTPAHKVRTDRHLWGTYIVLVMLAVIELFSASIQEVESNIFAPIVRHGIFLLVGLFLMLLLQRMHYRHIYALIPGYVLLCLLLMIGVHFAGSAGQINEAQRALKIGGVQLLPADALKLAVALGMAWILTRFRGPKVKGKHTDVSTTGLVLCILFLGACALVLFEHGLSNTIIVCAIGFSMMLVSGMSWKKFGIALLIFGIAGGAGMFIKTHGKADPVKQERAERIAALNMETADSIQGSGRGTVWNSRLADHFRPNKHLEHFSAEHQQEQLSYIAQANGGFFGVGIGRSREAGRLPLADIDYIYAIIIEELGVFVGIVILITYLWILGRSAKLTMSFKKTLPTLMAIGCAFTIVFQALYHMAIVSGVFPVSGQPLPLFSRGGISVLTTSLAFGVMLSVSRHAVRNTDTRDEAKIEDDLLPDTISDDNPALIHNEDSN